MRVLSIATSNAQHHGGSVGPLIALGVVLVLGLVALYYNEMIRKPRKRQ
jgi:hypothetical protein